MSSLRIAHNSAARLRRSLLLSAIALFSLAQAASAAEPGARFERTYTPQGSAHVTISNINGSIRVTAWEKKTVTVRAVAAPSVSIQDQTSGDDITINVKRDLKLGRADFEVLVPPATSVTLKNYMGDIEVRRIGGHLSVNSLDSNVRLSEINSPSVDVKITAGDIFFDGRLHEGGSYTLQSFRGDIDVTVPAETPFSLNARALSENITLGDFISSLTGSARGPKGITGTHLTGGPRLTLTAYSGRIVLHKK
jgi:Putative adhesin